MKNKLKIFALLSTIGALLLFLSGCYTQLETTRGAYDDDEQYTADEQSEETSYIDEDEEYTESSEYCEDYRPRVGFSYYYPSYYWPSIAFSMAYADPWFYDYYWARDPWFYYSPYTWQSYYWYSPYYYYPYYGYYYTYDWSDVNRSRRYDGSIRGDVNIRGSDYTTPTTSTSRFDLPGGSSVGRTNSGKSNTDRGSAAVRDNSRRVKDSRSNVRSDNKSSVRTNNTGVRSSGSR
ncbi:MAG: hypothetical protein HY800_06180, partial [Ignavibacteriales bacterium]|nr:hypothetical protein [Ignavibacteriales bacterium]